MGHKAKLDQGNWKYVNFQILKHIKIEFGNSWFFLDRYDFNRNEMQKLLRTVVNCSCRAYIYALLGVGKFSPYIYIVGVPSSTSMEVLSACAYKHKRACPNAGLSTICAHSNVLYSFLQNTYWTMPKLDNFKPCAEQLASFLAQYTDLLTSSTFFTYSYLPAVTFTFCFPYKKNQ